ncbi:MAG: formyltransferase family protein, partial [Kiritimatiellaeota bacterium]|nr:formyltransferase family protein [Kiritimatiellota bacterium]
AVFKMCAEEGHEIVGVSAPLESASEPGKPDRLRFAAEASAVPLLPAGLDVILAAHSHDFIGRKTRLKTRLGAIGYHPSLLPRHRGRDAVRWTIKMGDVIAGGSVYWLSDNVDAGAIAAQDWCWVHPGTTADQLWRDQLFGLGVELFREALRDLSAGNIVAVPQEEDLVTWEPSWSRAPLRRPDLLMLGGTITGFNVRRDGGDLHRGGRR